jgi:hypothetical protein
MTHTCRPNPPLFKQTTRASPPNHTHIPLIRSAFLLLSDRAKPHHTNGGARSVDAAGGLPVGAGRRGRGRGAAVAGGMDGGVGLVDAAAARPGPAGPGPQGHPVQPLHRRPEGERPDQPRGSHQAAAARLPRHRPPRAAHAPQSHQGIR